VRGRLVLLADGLKAPKEGRQMPGVKSLHQELTLMTPTRPAIRTTRPSSAFSCQPSDAPALTRPQSGASALESSTTC
jgi:hypothetical protein